MLEQDLTAAEEGVCTPGPYRMERVSCPPTFERRLFGGVEWWSLGVGIEQSSALEDRRAGDGLFHVQIGAAAPAPPSEVEMAPEVDDDNPASDDDGEDEDDEA